MPTSLTLLAPEVVLCLGAFLVILLDLAMPGGRSRRPLLYCSLFVVIVAGGLAVGLLGRSGVIFNGMVLVDPFSMFFKLIFLTTTGLVLLSSVLYADRLRRWEAEYYAILLFGTVGLMLLASAGEFITVFLALELSSLANAFLGCWSKRSIKATEGALKY